ncbi:solute carrier family 23 member 1-like isoform X2 [Gigantopelta aegis]|uniref:solute carrier family 23 member 1-like isoform X2 n=1 Tax=Gigantopelta aegis TaxID=1735272 RepID=UPI001B88CEE6|nr:solute carrier family 23 member 1-like isoform X2 [Gigantopelta aegis]
MKPGSRLPIVQSCSYSFIPPIIALMTTKQWSCPYTDTSYNQTLPEYGSSDHKAMWHARISEVSGALLVASVFQVVIGFSGLLGLLLRFIGPLTIAPTIALIGLSLFSAAADKASKQWWIALLTVVLIVIFSQYLRKVNVPCCQFVKGAGCKKSRIPLFNLFPVLIAILVAWLICVALTAGGALTNDPDGWGYKARTDIRSDVLHKSSWFRFPYPGQWGLPTVSLAGVFGMLAGVIASIIESIGDYYACARLSGAPPPPGSAISRGIGTEGITCILAGAWGTGGGNTSYSENIGAIGITKVGSRAVIQVGAIIMIILGCFGKFGALFLTIPEPIIGGMFFVMFSMVTAVGLSNLQHVDMNSSRNLFIFGLALFSGLALPRWVASHPDVIQTNNDVVDQILTVLLSTSMLVGGIIALVLDNTIPGTPEERGISNWQKVDASKDCNGSADMSVYDLPLVQRFFNKMRCTKYVPVCPTFIKDKRRQETSEPQEHNSEGSETYIRAGLHNPATSKSVGLDNHALTGSAGLDNPAFVKSDVTHF